MLVSPDDMDVLVELLHSEAKVKYKNHKSVNLFSNFGIIN